MSNKLYELALNECQQDEDKAQAFVSNFDALVMGRADIAKRLEKDGQRARGELCLALLPYASLGLSLLTHVQVNVHHESAKTNFSVYLLVKGIKELIGHNPRLRVTEPVVVYEECEFNYIIETLPDNRMQKKITHRPSAGVSGKILYVYLNYSVDGVWDTLVVPRARLKMARDSARSKDVWNKHSVAMSKNVALKEVIKYLPLSHQELRDVNKAFHTMGDEGDASQDAVEELNNQPPPLKARPEETDLGDLEDATPKKAKSTKKSGKTVKVAKPEPKEQSDPTPVQNWDAPPGSAVDTATVDTDPFESE